jgi:enamine deaminase RidA (YjgF/YER057c/UK114 family)
MYFSQAVIVDKTMYMSGQLGLDPATGVMVSGGVAAETEQVRIFVTISKPQTAVFVFWYF